jgi:hypothetical protein
VTSNGFAVGSGCLFLLVGAFLLFSAMVAIGVGINAIGPAVALALPELVVALALFARRGRRISFLLGIMVGVALTAYWWLGATTWSESSAIGGGSLVLALLAAAATLLSVGGAAQLQRERAP